VTEKPDEDPGQGFMSAWALFSLSERSGASDFAKQLVQAGILLLATDGTAEYLRSRGISVQSVAEQYGSPELLGGRVKTLHPELHAGILARPGDLAELRARGTEPIDYVIVSLYPFVETWAQHPPAEDLIEQIDIGGVAMIRAAAKNHERVTVIVDPSDYGWISERLRDEGTLSQRERHQLAAKAFRLTASYDALIARWLTPPLPEPQAKWPEYFPVSLELGFELRYGDNPHQRAAFYINPMHTPSWTLVSGETKPLSYNNLLDIEAASSCIRQVSGIACVIVKHASPCAMALARDPIEAYQMAYEADPVSAFGGIIALNRPVDANLLASIFERQFVEILIAPSFTPEGLVFLHKRPKVRAVQLHDTDRGTLPTEILRSAAGGYVIEETDQILLDEARVQCVTRRQPTDGEWADLRLAWHVARSVPSNAIVLVRQGRTVGIGGGQPNRPDSLLIAKEKASRAGFPLESAVLASDGFLPFPDVVETAGALGISAIIQPGGSLKDRDAIVAADTRNMAMLLTGLRHFRH
jgi:phosphoribosylaminoimidazolecarboxamide formyltransferase/IMP cyclohydrolase